MLTGIRLRLFTLADELGNVAAACRAMGVDRSTYYRLKKRRSGWFGGEVHRGRSMMMPVQQRWTSAMRALAERKPKLRWLVR